jgi:hypothetical protein
MNTVMKLRITKNDKECLNHLSDYQFLKMNVGFMELIIQLLKHLFTVHKSSDV